jgi:hypothetical protein
LSDTYKFNSNGSSNLCRKESMFKPHISPQGCSPLSMYLVIILLAPPKLSSKPLEPSLLNLEIISPKRVTQIRPVLEKKKYIFN